MTEMDTRTAIESLTRTGFSEEQARAVVGVVCEAVDERGVGRQDFDGVKQDVGVLRQDVRVLKQDVGDLRLGFGNLTRDFHALEMRLEAKLDARFAGLEASIANTKVQMMLYTGAIVAGIAAVTRLFG